jgi:hypothetical protein
MEYVISNKRALLSITGERVPIERGILSYAQDGVLLKVGLFTRNALPLDHKTN